MFSYIIRRLLLIIPTLVGIMIVNFVVIQIAPGGPIDVIIAQVRGNAADPTARLTGQGGEQRQGESQRQQTGGERGRYRGAQGVPPELIQQLEREFEFDKPWYVRFVTMMGRYLTFNLGNSFFRDRSVVELVLEKMPVSISLGLTTTIIIYLIAIPLGIRQAVHSDTRFDRTSTALLSVGDSIPSFLFAILLIVLFAGGSFLKLFPLRGLVSDGHAQLSLLGQILDRAWHLVLPVTAMVISGFAGLALLTRNSFLEEINKLYVVTARSKGLAERRVLYGHVFRNAMLIVIAGFPGAFISIFFTGNLLMEIIFSLDGLGLLGFEAAINRDYPMIFGTLYFFTLLGLFMTIVRDITYHLVDPRIDFEGRG
jgi:microcin C transport system permease protein